MHDSSDMQVGLARLILSTYDQGDYPSEGLMLGRIAGAVRFLLQVIDDHARDMNNQAGVIERQLSDEQIPRELIGQSAAAWLRARACAVTDRGEGGDEP